MVSLNDREAAELHERLRGVPVAQSAEETVAVSVNASTSVTFTETEKTAVVDVITIWLAELGPAGSRRAARGAYRGVRARRVRQEPPIA
jgi:hypothetical protein